MIRIIQKHIRAVAVLGALLLAGACVAQASNPAFVGEPLLPTSRGQVAAIRPAGDLDVVYLDGGYDQGFRTGMECQVVRDSALIAELVLIDVRPAFAAALILDIRPQTGIRNGDVVRIKTLSLDN